MKYLVALFLLFSVFTVQAQKVTGYWYGQANVEMSGIQNNYLTELIISQKGNKVKGFFGYYFKDIYQSFVVKGTFDPKTRKIVIYDIPIIYFKTNSTENSVDCITSFYGTLRVSKVKTELIGYFYRDKKYTYTCPDLRVNYTLYTEARVTDSIFKDMSSTRRYWKPQPPEPEFVKSNDASQQAEMQALAGQPDASVVKGKDAAKETEVKSITGSAAIAKNQVAGAETTNSQKNKTGPPETANSQKNKNGQTETTGIQKNNTNQPGSANKEKNVSTLLVLQPTVQPDIFKINEDFKKRKQIVSKQIEVASDSVRLSFYDNAEVDGDSISVFLNGKLVVAHKELTERAFNVYLELDSNKEINEVSMFAENLGKYPPNTALMVLSDGDKRYETYLSSDFKGNATIRLKLRRNLVAGN
jgi:hypothetical protein